MDASSDPISDPRRPSAPGPGDPAAAGPVVGGAGPAAGRAATLFFGLVCVATGLVIVAVAFGWLPVDEKGLHAPRWLIAAAGAAFVLAGLAVANRWPQWLAGLLAALIVSLFAAVMAWVALGDGPRHFSGSGTGLSAWLGWHGETTGRRVFGVGAAIVGLVCLLAWTSWLRCLSGAGRLAAIGAAVIAGYLAVEVMPREPRLGGATDDHARIAHYLALEPAYAREARRHPRHWNMMPWQDTESWLKAARTRLAAGRVAPPGTEVLVVPRATVPPTVDGIESAGEWAGALWIPMRRAAEGTAVGLLTHGGRLYVAARAPADTTTAGYDQLRFWFHVDLSPHLANERVFVRGSGRASALRAVRDGPGEVANGGRADAAKTRTQWHVYRQVHAASRVEGYRRYEFSLDMSEAGIVPGAALPAYFVLEGDPVLDEAGKFRARTILGRAGRRKAPLWLRVDG